MEAERTLVEKMRKLVRGRIRINEILGEIEARRTTEQGEKAIMGVGKKVSGS